MPAYVSINTNLNNTKYNSVAFKNTCETILQSDKLIHQPSLEINFKENPNIKISNICFSYNDKLVLNDISYEFNSGKMFGIKGISGSGKTTLLNLLLGLLNPSSGEIFINKKKFIGNLTLPNNLFSYVPQEIYLLDNSIVENIAIGIDKNAIDYNFINEIIKELDLDEFVKNLPKGLETSVGDKGVKISGGQKQRIGLARALYSQPKIIILDEATNAMDSKLEEKILKNLNNMKKDKIIILVAHNDEILKECDEKIEISNGKII